MSVINFVIFWKDKNDYLPKLEYSHSPFMQKNQSNVLVNKVILPILLGIITIGVTQFAFAEVYQETSYIAVDEEKFEQPTSKYYYQEITITGHIADYSRGANVSILIIDPNGSEDEINTFASKKGDIYTLLHITQDSQIGIHQVILKHNGEEIASTSFEILENQ